VTARTKALLPVHLYGHPCDMDAVMRLARSRGLRVVEDCAQAIGARWRGVRVGSIGDAGALSFYPTKNLAGCGDGGMVVTNDAALAGRVRLLRAHGSRDRYRHLIVGRNSRLDELQAALLRVKLKTLERGNATRRRHARRYAQAFRRLGVSGIALPRQAAHAQSVYHLYCIRTPRREQVRRRLAALGIDTQVAYPSTLPAQPALRGLKGRGACPRAEEAARTVLALPIYPELRPRQIDAIAAAVAGALGAGAAPKKRT
jgi:dTDP-4-amino-4,6-dideoxygalactose transaminase